MKTIQLTKGFEAIVDDEDYDFLSRFKWHASKGKSAWYARRMPWNGDKQVCMFMHRELMQCPDGYQVDHINHNTLDNRRSNLRICTASQNTTYKRLMPTRSGHRGVSWNERYKRWKVQCGFNGKLHFFGYYDDPEEAARIYNQVTWVLNGEFAIYNIIKTPLGIAG